MSAGGIRGRVEATGRGVFYGVREVCSVREDMDALGLSTGLEGKRIVIQGLGNVGYHAAQFFQRAGALLVGLAESEGAIQNPKGLDIEKVVVPGRSGARSSTSPVPPTSRSGRPRWSWSATSSFPPRSSGRSRR